jgi:hypothetical protein
MTVYIKSYWEVNKMLKAYREYKSLSGERKKWFKRAIIRRLRDYIAFIILFLIMSIEIH